MKFLGMGVPELLIILVVVLLIFGPKNFQARQRYRQVREEPARRHVLRRRQARGRA